MSVQDLLDNINIWSNSYKNKAEEKRLSRGVAENVDELENKTPSEVLTILQSKLQTHIDDKDNPHQTTANDLNIYTTSETDALLDKTLLESTLPISCFKDRINPIDYTVDVPDLYTFEIISEEKIYFHSVLFTLEPVVFDLTTLSSTYDNETFYLYVKKDSNNVQWTIISLTDTTEENSLDSEDSIYIGVLNTDNTGIINVELNKPILIGTSRLSETTAGQAIPVTTGSPQSIQTLGW